MQNACYEVDWPSVEREFPPDVTPPWLLAQFAQFLRTQSDGSLGSFAIAGDRLCDGAMPGGDDLAEYFGLFCSLGDGSQVGFWFDQDAHQLPEHAPIVLIAHDDAPSFIAPNLGEFLWRISDADLDATGIPCDFQPDEDSFDARPALRKWLTSLGPREQHAQGGLADENAQSARFDRFVEQSISAYESAVQSNPILFKMSQILKPYWMTWTDASELFRSLESPGLNAAIEDMRPFLSAEDQQFLPNYSSTEIAALMEQFKGQKTPKSELIEISAAGGAVQISRLDQGGKIILPESAQLMPLILQLREQQVQLAPERGLWHYASITLGEKGEVSLSRAARAWPQFVTGNLSARCEALVKADLATFPRSAFWQLEAQKS